MKAVSAEQLPWLRYPGQRVDTIEYQALLQGEPGSLDNYEMSFVSFDKGSSFSPRHRHNFDQFRWAFEKPVNYSPKFDVLPGYLGYFPEGAYYGPQDIVQYAKMLIVQFGGASSAGYMEWPTLMRGTSELKQTGEFVSGVYKRVERDGRRINKDGYEAVWEHVNGREITYPAARYQDPILINPDAFEWLPAEQSMDVLLRNFGTFNERGTSAGQVKMNAGATYHFTPQRGTHLFYILSGNVTVGNVLYWPRSAFEVRRGESAEFAASNEGEAVLLYFVMPDFSQIIPGAEVLAAGGPG